MRLLALLLAASLGWAQQTPTPSNVTGAVDIFTELQTKLDARKAKVGDPVRLKLLHALLSKGKVVIPEGATLVGSVTEVATRAESQPESRLAIRIERAEWKHNSVPFVALIVRHGAVVRRIVNEPPDARFGESLQADLMIQGLSGGGVRQSQAPPAKTPTSTTSSAPATPAPSTPPATPPAPSPTPPSPSPSPAPASTTPPAAPPGPVAQPTSPTLAQQKVVNRYAIDPLRAEGPRAVDVMVRLSADPSIGAVLVSTARDVVVPKGALLVLRQARTASH